MTEVWSGKSCATGNNLSEIKRTGGEGFVSTCYWADPQDCSDNEDVGDHHGQESDHGNNTREDQKQQFIHGCVRTWQLQKRGKVAEEVTDDIGPTERQFHQANCVCQWVDYTSYTWSNDQGNTNYLLESLWRWRGKLCEINICWFLISLRVEVEQ